MLVLNNIRGKYAFLQLHYYFTKNKGAAKNEVLNFISSQLLKFLYQNVLYSAYSHKLHNFNKLFFSVIGGHNLAFCYDTTDRFAFMNKS